MPLNRGMWAACIAACVGTFMSAGGVRADSDLDIPQQTANGFLILSAPSVKWTVQSHTDTDTIGTLTVTGSFGSLDDSNRFGTTNPVQTAIFLPSTKYPTDMFTITATLDVKQVVNGASTTYTINKESTGNNFQAVEHDAVGELTLANSQQLDSFAINLDGSTTDSIFTYVFSAPTGYYASMNQPEIVAELEYLGDPSNSPNYLSNPISGATFFTATGSTTWNEGQYAKLDVFGIALPLPAPFWMGSLMLLGMAASAGFIKRRRVRS